ncbi:hypothetical protein RF11_07344 [Thelohanellus kitauei]|uniref:Uncharacterized protein n=1 Tax=Thelohanellus kitauei TaxID=669202 RepID=A0A0C2MKA5_THEKT|nr:hypothetical protein RF11_07344 [Thelohanellus kitauei]
MDESLLICTLYEVTGDQGRYNSQSHHSATIKKHHDDICYEWAEHSAHRSYSRLYQCRIFYRISDLSDECSLRGIFCRTNQGTTMQSILVDQIECWKEPPAICNSRSHKKDECSYSYFQLSEVRKFYHAFRTTL